MDNQFNYSNAILATTEYIIMDNQFNYSNAILATTEYIILNFPIMYVCAFFTMCGMMGGDIGTQSAIYLYY